MRRVTVLAAMLAITAAAAATAGTVTPQPAAVLGVWRNPKGTLAVRTAPCDGGALCGAIVWAGPQAVADAQEAGVPRLVGTELLQDYRANGPGRWSGRVFVPDLGRSFASRIEQTGTDQLTISGCLIGRLFCKTQTWRRVG